MTLAHVHGHLLVILAEQRGERSACLQRCNLKFDGALANSDGCFFPRGWLPLALELTLTVVQEMGGPVGRSFLAEQRLRQEGEKLRD